MDILVLDGQVQHIGDFADISGKPDRRFALFDSVEIFLPVSPFYVLEIGRASCRERV